ncbi:vacuolar protein sorting-associated protein 13B [Schistocerca piceifrons]|uniref:vacuolar protein sorting-associated protein 13B n=1 Tax=Schistocerca piceifrons TaxID=274613 RepID=UPI001F5ECEB7|nr:vacuolar protein sorting-associated protein 13B [Schistocerca piceifrons]
MFKLESYITPILLSYVDKYIKNFRHEDSQVSLWGGDASFHNLELRLEVLEQELQLPFSFASGHIHELLIHVPWTKLNSEPISITINTIECILNLKNEDTVCPEATGHSGTTSVAAKESRRKPRNQENISAPPGYVQSMVNRIVSNINVQCNNLILKYVEEDIVLSVNVKTVTLQSANNEWKPSFADVSSVDVTLRKVVSLTDLTICLDKRNASGKIEMYQEPLLYRCSLDIRLLCSYLSPKSKRAKVTRIDVHCGRMDFSLTEQQVPMLMRLVLLLRALHSRELQRSMRKDSSTGSHPIVEDTDQDLDGDEDDNGGDDEEKAEESWAGWALSFVPSLYPAHGTEEWENDQYIPVPGPTMHAGFYMEQASVSLKVTESTSERSYYGPRKVKFVPFLFLQLQGCYGDVMMHGSRWLNARMGISYASLEPHGDCFCGVKENGGDMDAKFFSAGHKQENYLADSLFDVDSVENKGRKRNYNILWDFHVDTITEALLLEKTPALAFDYLYMLELPDDFNSERLSELGSDLEYSNLPERALCRVVVGPMLLRLSSGLFHRLQAVQGAALLYDYCPYSVPKPEPSREQLPPASAEDFEALEANIPVQVFQITFFKPEIQLQLATHPPFEPSVMQANRKRKRSARIQPLCQLAPNSLPQVTLECQCLDAKMVRPMYPKRLVKTTCQLPSPPQHMFDMCHSMFNVKFVGIASSLILDASCKRTTVLLPSNLSFSQRSIVLPQYWVDPAIPHIEQTVETEIVTVTCTKAKMLVIECIVQSVFNASHTSNIINTTTLLQDARKEMNVEYLEIGVEGVVYHQVLLPHTDCHAVTVGAVRAFVLLPKSESTTDQAVVLIGPDTASATLPLFSCSLQRPLSPKIQSHPPLLGFHLREVNISVDPLLWRWLQYTPHTVTTRMPSVDRITTSAPSTSGGQRRVRRMSEGSRAPTPQESVHSSSDREMGPVPTPSMNIEEVTVPDEAVIQTSWWSREWALEWFPVWRGLVICGDLRHSTLYLPTETLSAVGSHSVEEALQQSPTCCALILRFPSIVLRTSSPANTSGMHLEASCLSQKFPIELPPAVWNKEKMTFPWSISMSDLSICTFQKSRQLHFLKPVSATATVAITTKYKPDETSLSSLYFCVHIDTTPVKLAVSQIQMSLMARVIFDVLDVVSAFSFGSIKQQQQQLHVPETIPEVPAQSLTSPTVFRESSGSHESLHADADGGTSPDPGGVKMTAWIQSTLAKLVLSLYVDDKTDSNEGNEYKLSIDLEDIMTSLDLQHIYSKLKCKVASANVLHFKRSSASEQWKPGIFLGLVMRGQDDISTPPSPMSHQGTADEGGGGFLSMTFTRAQCTHVHTQWGTNHLPPAITRTVLPLQANKSISEIVIKMQAVDFLLPPAVLGIFIKILMPMVSMPAEHGTTETTEVVGNNWLKHLNNSTLPLLYLDTRAIRVILPACDIPGAANNVMVVQLDEINISPQVKNPLGRSPLRPDIWRLAEQSRMLAVPGSEVEDRQYQIDIHGLSASSGPWNELEKCLGAVSGATSQGLRTMAENPALAWNSLDCQGTGSDDGIVPRATLSPVLTGLNLCIVLAPAVVYRGHVLVCGAALEVNAVSDVLVTLSTSQLLLASALAAEIVFLFYPFINTGAVHENCRQQGNVLSQSSPKYVKQHSHIVSPRDSAAPSSGFHEDTFDTHASGFQMYRSSSHVSMNISQQKCPNPKESGREVSDRGSSSNWNKGHISPSTDKICNTVPLEILLTSGTVSLILYDLSESGISAESLSSLWQRNFISRVTGKILDPEKEGEPKVDSGAHKFADKMKQKPVVYPLLHIIFAQPHTFFSNNFDSQKLNVSCFDLSVKLGREGTAVSKTTPSVDDFPFTLVETKGGDPHPDTGIPPSLVTVKLMKPINRAPKIEVDLGRPVRFCVSIPTLEFLTRVERKLADCFLLASVLSNVLSTDSADGIPSINEQTTGLVIGPLGSSRTVEVVESEMQETNAERRSWQLPGRASTMNVRTQQIVLSLEVGIGTMLLSIAGVQVALSCTSRLQSDKVVLKTALTSLVMTVSHFGSSPRVLLNPWSCTAECHLLWDMWSTFPQAQVTANSDSILIDVGPEHLQILQLLINEYQPLLQNMSQDSPVPTRSEHNEQYFGMSPVSSQHYKDDLRAGAFQFVEAAEGSRSAQELPLPYQIVFWSNPPTMAWRYPQPRTLTRVDIFPVPYKMASNSHEESVNCKEQVLCSLQYWSDARNSYQEHSQFQLSESDICRLKLPEDSHPVVSCTWRVQLILQTGDEDSLVAKNVTISPHSLAACMRVDSFFSPELVPHIQLAVNVTSIQISLYNHLQIDSPCQMMPVPLQAFTWDGNFPSTQRFFSVLLDTAALFFCHWNSEHSSLEFTSSIRCDSVDFAYLTQQCIVEPFRTSFQINFGNSNTASLVMSPINIRLGPSIGHSLGISSQLWTGNYADNPESQNCIIISRYVICNDMMQSIRFGQAMTDEDILLGSRQCHMYAWRTHKARQMMHVGTENGGWVWSQPFEIDRDGTNLCCVTESSQREFSLIVKVTSLSATQKQVVISGQLIITNLLVEHFECKVLPVADADAPMHPVRSLLVCGKDTAPSVLLEDGKRVVLRIRFHGLESLWSGDIPLEENVKTNQPWLVKVPLQDKTQFLSVWCRIIRQPIGNGGKILAVLSPLFMIRSHLPLPAKVFVDTPGLKVHLESIIKGKGDEQQLYCPGTIEHTHKLTFQLENSILPSDPYVPLSYTMVDRQQFPNSTLRKGVDIDVILDTVHNKQGSCWPFVGEEYAELPWETAEQPQTHVQVEYKLHSPYSGTLLVDVQPWALIVNTLGCTVSLIIEGSVICNIPHIGVVAPPKMESTFVLSFHLRTLEHCSCPLQLEQRGRISSFYMPHISGVIPSVGHAQIPVQQSKVMCFANLKSDITDEIRILHIRPSYIVCNHTNLELQMSCLLLKEKISMSEFHNAAQSYIVVLPEPQGPQSRGVPVTEWTLVGGGEDEINHYVSFNKGGGWCCPIKVIKQFGRHSFTVPVKADDKCKEMNEAFVLSIQVLSDQIFLHVHCDPHPQMIIHNKCSFKLLCAQGTVGNDGSVVFEASHIDWLCEVHPNKSSFYSLPYISKQFPNIVKPTVMPQLVFACYNEGLPKWSQGLDIIEVQEQFLYLPNHGDVRVHSEFHCHTLHITVDTVSHVEISARDIRIRLIQTHMEKGTGSISDGSSPVQVATANSEGEDSYRLNVSTSDTTFNISTPLEEKSKCLRRINSEQALKPLCSDAQDVQPDTSPKNSFLLSLFLKGLNIILTEDLPSTSTITSEILSLTLDNVCISAQTEKSFAGQDEWHISFNIGDMQLDNQMFKSGGFDFPVILIGQAPKMIHFTNLRVPASVLIKQTEEYALIKVFAILEKKLTGDLTAKSLRTSIGPLSLYIEDNLKIKLIDKTVSIFNKGLFFTEKEHRVTQQSSHLAVIPIPQAIEFQAQQIAFPIQLQSLTIEPLSMLLSVHMTAPLYVALDCSPLHFTAFQHRYLVTTPYRLGHTLTMHYLSGAIFGAGWVVGSLELLGTPGGFARTVGSGLWDFVNMPYQGIFQGPWAFIAGVTHGSASLMKHVTAGTLSSVTKLAASLARNLDRLTLDAEHLERTEERRRQPPQGLTQGVVQGLTGLGISLLGAVGGIAHHPLQSMIFGGNIAASVGRGLVGVVTKPLSGAADFVALAGQGLLHGTGWSTVLQIRHQPSVDPICGRVNSHLKYSWKLVSDVRHPFLYVVEAVQRSENADMEAVTLLLTVHALFLINVEQDNVQKVLSLSELTTIEKSDDPTLISLCFQHPVASIETDTSSRARVVNFVRQSGGLVTSASDCSPSDSGSSNSCGFVKVEPRTFQTVLTFFVNPQQRDYLIALLTIIKRQCQGRGFPVL